MKNNESILRVMEIIEQFLKGDYDPLSFSYDFPEKAFENYDKMSQENPKIAEYLDQTMPYICDEYEPGMDPADMKGKVRTVYQKVMEML